LERDELKFFADLLEQKERELEEDLSRFEVSLEVEEREQDMSGVVYSQDHPADKASILFERERMLSARKEMADNLREIKHALWKIRERPEAFGRCERCGAEIDRERLKVKPWARFCLSCKKRLEGSA